MVVQGEEQWFWSSLGHVYLRPERGSGDTDKRASRAFPGESGPKFFPLFNYLDDEI